MADYLDTFKQYVPAEILAGFTAINAVLEHDEAYDIVVISSVIGVLCAIFVAEALISGRIKSKFLIAVTTLTLPFWCALIAIDRYENWWGAELPRGLITAVLILASLTLTLFGRSRQESRT